LGVPAKNQTLVAKAHAAQSNLINLIEILVCEASGNKVNKVLARLIKLFGYLGF
jgi:hypothetical protein